MEKNTSGGAVNFITVRPDYDTEGYFNVGIGNNSLFEFSGAFQTAQVCTGSSICWGQLMQLTIKGKAAAFGNPIRTRI